MGKTSAARRHTSWVEYHPELVGIRGKQAKANMRTTAHDAAPAPVEMERLPDSFDSPESSTIARACYDSETGTLSVHFKRAKTEERYDYAAVPAELWAEFLAAESKGQFFGARIRPVYEGQRIIRTK